MFVYTKVIKALQNKHLLLNVFVVLLINPVKGQSARHKPEPNINLNVNKITLFELINVLKSQSAYEFFYDKEAAKKMIVPGLRITNLPLTDALRKMHKELPLDFQILRNEITVQIQTKEQYRRRVKQDEQGKITGMIVDESGESLPGATIKVAGSALITQSRTNGTYQLNLPPGRYTIEVSFISFQTKRITDIVVRPGENTPLNVLLKGESKSLNEVVITSGYRRASIEGLYARQKNSAAVSDGITAEQISRTPANNTAQVLAKVSGIQLSNDRSVVVRGLSDRYNNVLLNGAMLPSSEPNRRDFSFDMIPSALLDNVIVNKTATPDLTGEFTGGLVQINTKDIPTENFLQLTVGTGYNTLATGKHIVGLDHGNKAWMGMASDIHRKPEGMTFADYNRLAGSLGAAPTDGQRVQMNAFLGTMPDNWRMKEYRAEPVYTYQLQAGRVLPFRNDNKLGIVAALSYRNEQRADQKDIFQINGFEYNGNQFRYLTTLGGSLNAGYSFAGHKITLQNTYNRKFSDDLWRYNGTDFDNSDTRVSNYNNVTVINALLQSQLSGEHKVSKKGLKLDWNFSAARLDRDQPYSRLLTRMNGSTTNTPEEYFYYGLTDNKLRNGSLFYSELDENLYNWGSNVQLPFKFLGQSHSVKGGYQGKYRDSRFSSDMYRMLALSGGTYGGIPYYDIFNRENFTSDLYLKPVSTDGRELSNSTSSSGYEGFQRLHAFYGMLDLRPLEKLRLIGGIRAENNNQNVFDEIWNTERGVYETQTTSINQTDWLPSVNAVYALSSLFNIRTAWYKTVQGQT